jgi:hypothetical protein
VFVKFFTAHKNDRDRHSNLFFFTTSDERQKFDNINVQKLFPSSLTVQQNKLERLSLECLNSSQIFVSKARTYPRSVPMNATALKLDSDIFYKNIQAI